MVITKKCDNCSWQQNGRYCGSGGGGVRVCVCVWGGGGGGGGDGEEIIHRRSTNILFLLQES